ncbi:MAG: divalent-cation tolerance protein CutA [Betaproteobacteria bacterium]|nr:divalent-cation tolerance protein CutA [Betaproteobacteria bacterium]
MPQPKENVVIALCCAPDSSTAQRLTQELLSQRLAACVNLISGIQSHYWWQGKMQSADEVLMIIKTTEDRTEALKGFMQTHHPYDTPELIVLPISAGLDAYLAWVKKETRP